LHHSKAASAALNQYLGKFETVIVLIQEPWAIGSKICGLGSKERDVFVGKTDGKLPRAGILVSKQIDATLMPEFSCRDLTSILLTGEINGHKINMVFASCYMPVDSQELPPTQALFDLVSYCKSKFLRLVVGTDSNAWHSTWGSISDNARGIALMDFFMSEGLFLGNTGIGQTFEVNNKKSIIDLTFSNRPNLIHNWRVDETPSLSDHNYLRFEVFIKFPPIVPFRNKRKTDWDRFDFLIGAWAKGREVSAIQSVEQLEKSVEEVQGALMEAFVSSCPLPTKKRKKIVPWWRKDLTALKRELNKQSGK